MATIDLRSVDEDLFTVRFVTENADIDVYTLSQALSGFADALREINRVVNPDYELEVILESTGRGSFLAKLRTKKFAKTALVFAATSIILPLFLAYLYDVMKGHQKPIWRLEGNEFVLETESDVIKLPISEIEHKKQIADNAKVAQGVRKAVVAVKQDMSVYSLDIMPRTDSDHYPFSINIPRERFDEVIFELDRNYSSQDLLSAPTQASSGFRDSTQRAELTIIKAVLKRSPRKWQFVMNGLDISAPITDASFFDHLQLREISLSQGDALDADLKTFQSFDEDNRVWRTTHYQVVRVHGVIPGTKPAMLDLDWDAGDPD